MGKGGLTPAVLAAMLAVAACGTPDEPASTPVGVRVAYAPAPVVQTAAAAPATSADPCQAGDLQWLVGKPKTEIPVPVEVVNRRVACTTCPVTEDYSPVRLNIFFNADTDIVEQVRCG